jgi:hypothetical protein
VTGGALCRDRYICRKERKRARCTEALDGGSFVSGVCMIVSMRAHKRERVICGEVGETGYVR